MLKRILKYYNVSKTKHIPDYVVIAGDFNTKSGNGSVRRTLRRFRGKKVLDNNPADQDGNPKTNRSRKKRYDYVYGNHLIEKHLVELEMGDLKFAKGLVFDSRVFTPLSLVSPVRKEDCDVLNMQHMAVIKEYLINN